MAKLNTVYFDVDGTLGKWYADARGYECLEQIIDPANHYFRDIEPHPFMIDLAKRIQEHGQRFGYDVCVLTATDERCQEDRLIWLHENMPFIDNEHIIMCPVGANKADYVPDAYKSVLVDDYNKNLDEWSINGGVAIKAINTVNSHQNEYAEIDMTTPEKDLEMIDNAFEDSYLFEKSYEKALEDAEKLIADTLCQLAYRDQMSKKPANKKKYDRTDD